MIKRIHFSIVALVLASQSLAAQLPGAKPAAVSMSAVRLAEIDSAIQLSISKHETPGAVVLAARNGRVVWRKAYGSRVLEPARERMTLDTIFDVASLTKVVATATSIMILVERGKIRLADPVSKYIPELTGEGRERITIEHLLTHRSGYAPDFNLKERWTGYDEAMKRLAVEPLRNPAGAKFVYSDIGFIALGEVVRQVSGMRLDEFAHKNIFQPLEMYDTGFRPRAALVSRTAPTEKRRGQLSYLGDTPQANDPDGERWLRGQVHDPTSFRMNGVAGHAGLFSTVDDLAIYAQMILNGGHYGHARILSPLGVAEMTRPRLVADNAWTRGLGWDINTSYSTNRGELFPLGSFGHTGFTGASMWIDPATNMFVIFLSNRVHPDGKGDVASVRGKVSSIVAGAVTDISVAAEGRLQQSRYYETLIRDLARFTASRESATAAGAEPTETVARVLNGIDVLERDGFKQLGGLKIGLVTNHTGRNRDGRQTIDVLSKATNVHLVALFSPEHGIRGVADEKISDSRDEATGLPIYSLYGESRRPSAEQLKTVDALVFDIQDIGARFYTYISTLGYVMEEAAKARKPVFVLDRPNPIGGVDVEGPIADPDKFSFTAYYSLPVRHGMTIGELAQFFNKQKELGCDLRVIRMDGWKRSMWFDATSQTWINPSPNMRSLTQATLYPGVGLLETTNVSVGRGTDTPFEIIGAPWINGPALAERLNRRWIPGVRFVPVKFKPKASVFKDEECSGINLVITDRAKLRPVSMGIEIAVAIRQLHQSEWQADKYLRLLVNSDTLERVKRVQSPEEIVRSWNVGLEEFHRQRAAVLLY